MLLPRSSGIFRSIFRNPVARRHASGEFTDKQKAMILAALNGGTDIELSSFMGSATLKRFMAHRESVGTFEKFEDIISIQGFMPATVYRLCRKILMRSDKAMVLANSITPALSRERIKTISNVASVNLYPPYLTFSKMSRKMRVMEWKHFKFMEAEPKKTKLDIHEAFMRACTLYPSLPSADIFIMETVQGPPKDTTLPDRQLVQTVLYTMLSFGEPEYPKVVLVRPTALAGYHNLQMGSDRVSCQDLFRELTENNEIKLPANLRDSYERLSGASREFLGINTLHCFAFLKTLPMHQAFDTAKD